MTILFYDNAIACDLLLIFAFIALIFHLCSVSKSRYERSFDKASALSFWQKSNHFVSSVPESKTLAVSSDII